jgi:hypothetical protein
MIPHCNKKGFPSSLYKERTIGILVLLSSTFAMICLLCRAVVQLDRYESHYEQYHGELKHDLTKSVCLPFTPVVSFHNVACLYRLNLTDSEEIDVDKVFEYVQVALNRCIRSLHPPLHAKVSFTCRYSKVMVEDYDVDDVQFSSRVSVLEIPYDVSAVIPIWRDEISNHIEEYKGSRYFLDRINEVNLSLINTSALPPIQ